MAKEIIKMHPHTLAEINRLVDTFKFVFLYFENQQVYFLKNHHRYLDPEDALRIRLGQGRPPQAARQSNRNRNGKVLYITKHL